MFTKTSKLSMAWWNPLTLSLSFLNAIGFTGKWKTKLCHEPTCAAKPKVNPRGSTEIDLHRGACLNNNIFSLATGRLCVSLTFTIATGASSYKETRVLLSWSRTVWRHERTHAHRYTRDKPSTSCVATLLITNKNEHLAALINSKSWSDF